MRLVAVQDSDSLTLLTGGNDAFDSTQTISATPDRQNADDLIARKSLAMDIDDEAIRRVTLREARIQRQGTEGGNEFADIAFAAHVERSQ